MSFFVELLKIQLLADVTDDSSKNKCVFMSFYFLLLFVVRNNLSALKKKELSLCNVKRTFCQISPNPPCVTVSA